MTTKQLKESEENDDLKSDRQRLKDFIESGKKCLKYMDEIITDDNKRLDELHNRFVCENDIDEIEELQLIKKVFDFLKRIE